MLNLCWVKPFFAPLMDTTSLSSNLLVLHVTQNSVYIFFYNRSRFLSFIASSQAQRAQSDFYITAPELRDFGLCTFREFDECFDLGYKSTMELIF